MSREAKTKKNEIAISSFDGSVFGGMMLAHLGHPVFKADWKNFGGSANKKVLCQMFLDLNEKLLYTFKKDEVEFVKNLLNQIEVVDNGFKQAIKQKNPWKVVKYDKTERYADKILKLISKEIKKNRPKEKNMIDTLQEKSSKWKKFKDQKAYDLGEYMGRKNALKEYDESIDKILK